MIAALVHDWPDLINGEQPVPKNAHVQTGVLLVPSHLPRGVLAYMDQEYRAILWPPCRIKGLLRFSREFVWAEGGRVLFYRIVDTPMERLDAAA